MMYNIREWLKYKILLVWDHTLENEVLGEIEGTTFLDL